MIIVPPLFLLVRLTIFAWLAILVLGSCDWSWPPCANSFSFSILTEVTGCEASDENCGCSKAPSYEELSTTLAKTCSSSDTSETLSQLVVFCQGLGAPIQSGVATSNAPLPATSTAAPLPATSDTSQSSDTGPQNTSPVAESIFTASTLQKVTSPPKSSQVNTANPTSSLAPAQTVDQTKPAGKYSESDKIALGVGIGFGLPMFFVAVLTLWMTCIKS